jgi:MFS family permease
MIAALRHRQFVTLWAALLLSNVGTWMQNVARSWLLYRMTGDNALYLGYLGAAFAVPMIVLPPLGGALADRIDRRSIVLLTQTLAAGVAFGLAFAAASGSLRPWHLIVSNAISGMVLAFDGPARHSISIELVPREDVQSAIALNAATFTTAATLGPAIAGAMLERMSPAWLFSINGASYAIAIAAVFVLPRSLQKKERTRTAIGDRTTLELLVFAAFAALLIRSYTLVLPAVARERLGGGAGSYGALLSAGGLGAIVTATVLAARKAHARAAIVASIVAAGAMALLGASRVRELSWLACALLGAATAVVTTVLATTIQLRTPSEQRGRVTSYWIVTLIGLPNLGALVLGGGLRFFSLPMTFAIAGGLFLVIALSLRRLLLEPVAGAPG